jgi:hypothetical protein
MLGYPKLEGSYLYVGDKDKYRLYSDIVSQSRVHLDRKREHVTLQVKAATWSNGRIYMVIDVNKS